MKLRKRVRQPWILAVVGLSLMLWVGTAGAITWTESGDAGNTPTDSQVTFGFVGEDEINGSLATNLDVDFFKIHISNPTEFSASILIGPSGSYLSLYNNSGVELASGSILEVADYNLGIQGNGTDYGSYTIAVIGDVSAVPLPGAVLLLGAGLGRLVLYSRRKLTDKN